ncbi:hypothetical protein [Variovorax sp. PAMC26660]|uniref:hypothetical protein n=1 Tax=Variovorax sp. PAMC26660 TaxID=2762322 RepID=UPI00164D238A|nr:hypothetical protein [Variovorax sp. PAMC26660]QNK65773.1 hypothetical protein H7F35_21460 [Variovorax sp. PAMC26660]
MSEMVQKFRYYSGHIKVFFALAGILLAGALLGGTGVSAYYRETLQQEREVNRGMFVDLAGKMDEITKRLDGMVNSQATTAGRLQDTTTAVSEVVGKVDAAADKADKVAKAVIVQAAKVAKAIPAHAPQATVQPEVVNREIRRANERMQEHRK